MCSQKTITADSVLVKPAGVLADLRSGVLVLVDGFDGIEAHQDFLDNWLHRMSLLHDDCYGIIGDQICSHQL